MRDLMLNRTSKQLFWSYLFYALAAGILVPKSVLAGSLLVSWDPVQDSRLAGYKIKYGTTPGSYAQAVDVGSQTSHLLQNLTEGTRYYFVIVGYDSSRVEGAASSEVSGLVLAASTISSGSPTTNSAVVTWQTNKPSDTQVEYGTTTSYGTLTPLDSALLTSHSRTLTNLQPSTTYHFRVRSKDQGGSLVVSANFSFTTQNSTDTTPPGDVTNFTAIPSNGRVSLSWTNPTDADFKGVMLRYRSDGVYPTSKTDGVLAADRPGVAGAKDYFDHVGLANGTTYHYSAFTYDVALNFSTTAHVNATPANLSLSSLSPYRGSAGTAVVISGTGFGPTQGTSSVKFNGLAAQVSSWSPTSIAVTVPANATSGYVVVTVNGAETNGLAFKIGGKLWAPGRPRLRN